MKKSFILFLMFVLFTASSCTSARISNQTEGKISRFLKKVVADSLEEDYKSHDMYIHAAVAGLTIDGIREKETAQDNVYFVQGKVTYIVKGKRTWKDKEGNIIQLDPEQETTHWFTCGVLEDRYLGQMFKDDRNRLAFYAEKPMAGR